MPFLRFTRDKRGYEHFQLLQPGVNRRGTGKPRVLYWFRSPPNIRVGVKPFDDAARAALERHNPDVEFDWSQILATPIPSAEAERWRERRRQERAARQFTAEDAADEADSDASAVDGPEARVTLEGAAPAPSGTEAAAADPALSRRNRRRRRRRRPAGSVPDPRTPVTAGVSEPSDLDEGADDAAADRGDHDDIEL